MLKAYTAYDPEIGYAQGMNFIAVILLTYLPEEEDAFWALVYVLMEKGWRDIFNIKSDKIQLMLTDIETGIQTEFPEFYKKFCEEEYCSVEAVFSAAVITLYIYDAPFSVATRIFELFLVAGHRVIVQLTMGFIEARLDQLMRMQSFQLVQYLKKGIIIDVLAEKDLRDILKNRV